MKSIEALLKESVLRVESLCADTYSIGLRQVPAGVGSSGPKRIWKLFRVSTMEKASRLVILEILEV